MVLLIVGLVAYPFFYAICISFTDRVIGNAGKWIGFANFAYLAKNATFTALDLEHHRSWCWCRTR